MRKRILSLTLALVMVVLAVPVFALGVLADSAAAVTVNFRAGATYDEATLTTAPGEIIGSVDLAAVKESPYLVYMIPDEALEGTGLTAADILGWAYWDASAKKFVDLLDIANGVVAAPAAASIDVFPITYKSSYAANMPIISDTEGTLSLDAYRGGWTFTTPYGGKMDGPFAIDNGTKANLEWCRGILQLWPGYSPAVYGGIYQNGDIILPDNGYPQWDEYSVGLTYQVMKDGEYTVTIPKADDIQVLVVHNGVCVLGSADQIGDANPALDKTGTAVTDRPINADWFTFGKATDDGYADLEDATVSFDAAKGDKVDIIVKRHYTEEGRDLPGNNAPTDALLLKNWAPTVAYNSTTLNFRVGATYDADNKTTAPGKLVGTLALDVLINNPNIAPFDDEAFEGTGVSQGDIMTWAYWDAAEKKYVDLLELCYGMDELPDADVIDLYPVFYETTYTDGLPIVSLDGNTLTLDAFRSGWTFTTPYKTSGMVLMNIEQGTAAGREGYRGMLQAWAGDNAAKYGAIVGNGDIMLGDNTYPKWDEYAVGLSYQVTSSGKYTVTIPKASDIHVLVVVGDKCVFGPEGYIGAFNPALDVTGDVVAERPRNADWFTFGKEGDAGYDAMTDQTVEVPALKGEQIHIIVKRHYTDENRVITSTDEIRDDQWLRGWAPSIALADQYCFSFNEGPTATNGMNFTPAAGPTLSIDFLDVLENNSIFTDLVAQMMAKEGLLTWAAWDNTAKQFVKADDYFSGKVVATGDVAFYPIMMDSTTVPSYASWITGENQVIWSFEGEAVKNESEGTLVAFTGGWTYGAYQGSTYALLDYVDYTSTWLLVSSGAKYQSAGGAYPGTSGGFWSTIPGDAGATTLSYHAMASGLVDVKIPGSYNANLMTAVAVNGTFVWPEALAGQPAASPATAADLANWYTIPTYKGVDRTERYDAASGCVSFALTVSEGDRIDFLMSKNAASGTTEWWYPAVAYTTLLEAPDLLGAPTLGDTLSAEFAAGIPEGDAYAEAVGGVLIDGEEATSISVAPAEAGKTFTVQPYYTLGNVTIYGDAQTFSINDLLALYADDTTYGAAAKAALDYTAAFEAYFGEGEAATVPAFGGSYNTTVGVTDYTGDDEVTIEALSLIVKEKVGIKLVVSDLPEGAKLEIATDSDFENIINAGNDSFTATEDGLGEKFIMDGISIANFDTMYFFRVVDANGNAISDTVQYSVSTYCARMQNTTNAKLSALINALMNVYEATAE